MIESLDHISLIVSSKLNLSFYESLGFSVFKVTDRGYDQIVLMRSGSTALEIYVDPKHPSRVTNPEALGLRHFCLEADDLAGYVKEYSGEPVREGDGYFYSFIKDPDGLPIELRERKA